LSDNYDSFNLFFPLPQVTQDGTTHQPRHAGVDSKFDPNKQELHAAFCFCHAPPFNPVVAAHVGVLPAPNESNGNESSGSSEINDGVDATTSHIALEEGDHLGNVDDYLLTVHLVLLGATHLVVNVVKSQDHNFTVGSKRILSMARAHELYRQYNDM
jgi:hypothetical protein